MPLRVRTRALSKGTRARLLKKDCQGVASTVGTIMALLIFLAVMALITNSYVPAWMMDNERAHMNQVTDQFGDLKGKVDSMVVQWTIRGGPSNNMYAPVTLGSSGVPLFASPTIGILDVIPQDSSTSNISMTFNNPYNHGAKETVTGGGKVELYAPNRYYVQQWLAYENGALIVGQEDGQTLRAYPSLEFSRNNDKVDIRFTQIDLIGSTLSVAGSDSVGLNIELYNVDMQSYAITSGSWTLSINTTYGQAWQEYLSKTLIGLGLEKGTEAEGKDFLLTMSQPDPKTGVSTIELTIHRPNVLNHDHAIVRMTTVNP